MSRAVTMDDRARIRRGAAPKKRKAQPRLPAPRKARPQSRALVIVPPRIRAAVRRAMGWLLVLVLVGGLGAGVIAMRLPQMLGLALGEAIGDAGFSVRQVEINGIARMDRNAIEDAALAGGERAMPLVDLDAIRGRLMRLGWVADARVSRRWPDTLVVNVTERKPAAIWQFQRRLMLVDADGRPIERVNIGGASLPDVPTVIGENANLHLAALEALLATAPALKPVFDGATWMGNRRWDIRFKSGETLMLPEGDDRARDALAQFVKIDAQARLLGQGNSLFDMRNQRFVFTRSKERAPIAPGPAPATSAAPAPAAPPTPAPVPAQRAPGDDSLRNI